MSSLATTIIATSVVSFFSLSGIWALSVKEKTLHSVLFVLVAFSAGTILGSACLDLLPEAVELGEESSVFIYVTMGFLLFFFLERFIYWYHGHGHEADISTEIGGRSGTKVLAYLNLVGDGIHNFIDGMVIAVSYLVGFSIGLATTIAVVFHELPQEMGDYGILIYAGLKRATAIALNFVAALAVVVGGIFASFFIEAATAASGLLIALSAGGFIYLAASELIPELHKERDFGKSVIQFIIFLLGIVLIWSLGIAFPG